jgi:hypothetical protein
MPTFEDGPFGSGSSSFKESQTTQYFRLERANQGAVFSANGSYNPTNLAVENSLKEIFEAFHPTITGELKHFYEEEDESP